MKKNKKSPKKIFGKKSLFDAPIIWQSYSCEKKLSPLCLFVQTLPIYLAGMGGNGKKVLYTKITLQSANNLESPLFGSYRSNKLSKEGLACSQEKGQREIRRDTYRGWI
jgi:hypothetical protein